MKSEKVKELTDIISQLGKLIVGIEPVTPADWDAMEKMQTAHKQLRNIDLEELIESPPRAPFTQ